MARTRVDELARLMGVEPGKVLDILATMGSETRDNTTILSDREARAVRDAVTREALFKQREATKSQEPPKTAKSAAVVQKARAAPPAVQKARLVKPEPVPTSASLPAARRADGPVPERPKARPAPPALQAEEPVTLPEERSPAKAVKPAVRAAGQESPADGAPDTSAQVVPAPPADAAAALQPAVDKVDKTPAKGAKPKEVAAEKPAPRRTTERAAPPGRDVSRGPAGAQAAPGRRPADQRPVAPRPGTPAKPQPGRARPGSAAPGARAPGRPVRPGTPTKSRSRSAGRRAARDARRVAAADERRQRRGKVTIEGPVSVRDLAEQIGASIGEAVKQLMSLGIMATVNQVLDVDVATRLAAELGAEVIGPDQAADEAAGSAAVPKADKAGKFMRTRPPVITVMGHVDHGKTTLLDAIRKSDVASHEAGGITQHIGASVVNWQGTRIVFIDTPGHEAFTAMRARGAKVTDLVVLVVAADDGVKPQTVEAIAHIRAAKVPMIVAVNKIDRPGAEPERVIRQLSELGVVAEDWGGDTVFVNVSALKGEGIDSLLEMILLVTEMQELKANPVSPARGTVIEAKLDRGRGPVATILVQTGTITLGDVIVSGAASGRVRALFDEKGGRLDQAGPSQPVEVLGLDDVPLAGEAFAVVEDDKAAKDMVSKATEERRADQSTRGMLSLEDLYSKIQAGAVKDLNLVVKADVQGSLEALQAALGALSLEEVRLQILHGGVGPITESDVMLTAASDGLIIGFNVKPDANARRVAQREQVDIRTYQIIYEVLDDISAAAKGLLEPKMEKVLIGKAQVRATFGVPRVGIIAGCYVLDGRITRSAEVRVMRGGEVLHEGKVSSLKRFKDDAREVQAGFECGIGTDGFEAFEEGDIIEAYLTERVERAS